MITVDVLVSNKAWKKYIKNPNTYLKNRLKIVEKKLNIFKKNKLNFTILLSGKNEIKSLNKKFRKKNKATDILSFPFHKKLFLNKLMKQNKNNVYLGDIIINLNKIVEQSKKQNFNIVFDKIWVHGLVHLLGYRHKSNKDFYAMQKIENKIIKCI
jgi:probable rRNA maturation factor|tara:strand:+ start:3298 stop:3762 length:465 start_codon:yes stop_codon:yes gene_type:complete